MKKTLLVSALLTVGISQVQAAPFGQAFVDNAPERSAVTFTFSGDCSGKITDSASKVEAGVFDDHWNNKYSYFRLYTVGMSALKLEDVFYAQSVGSTTSVSVNKGVLSAKLSDTSAFRSGGDIQKVHDSGADGQIQCKNGYTLSQIIHDQGDTFKFVRDKSLTEKTSFTLKGKETPFSYKLSQKMSGYLLISKPICEITGSSSGNIAVDTYKSNCKISPKIKLTISATASGYMN